MTSLKICEDEVNNIFFENTRGKEAQKLADGNGLGMFMIRKALKLMGGSIYAECNNLEITTVDNKEFGENRFFIKINKT
jgi:signal transduction histidine kinase